MSNSVNSVTGELALGELGVTLMHEHVTIGSEGIFLDSRFRLDVDERFREATRSLEAAKAHGINTMVDATPIELCRDASFLRDVSEATGMNIVCATGLYMESHGVPAHFKHMPLGDLADLYVEEITNGIGDTGVRAGVIKVATSEQGVDDLNRKLLEAAADAQRRTGVPIITHTSGGHAIEQAKTLVAAGAEPTQIMIGHIDHKYSSFSYYERILRTGVNIAFDRCGLQIFLPDSVRAGLIASLLDAGLQDRIFLSMDSVSAHIGPKSKFDA
ncbi:phosphotriesterase family protein, partial [Rhodococcus sp. (in: high G+C Gram-positive bacteria)]|uniref:phosphotriesterase family protein n=1 Tax=Rhodococcus sp. TaxID=1831 RepID=UPI003BB02307